RDHRTLMVCSLVCHPWFSIARPHLFKDVVVSRNKTLLFSKLLASAAQSPEARVATFAYIRTVNFPGHPRLLHIYPPTGEDLQYADTVGEILTAIPKFTSLCLGPIHWPPRYDPTKTTISQMNLDSVVMMDFVDVGAGYFKSGGIRKPQVECAFYSDTARSHIKFSFFAPKLENIGLLVTKFISLSRTFVKRDTPRQT
ncbi:hypothetical protein B0H14DRAFT_2716640, partial [Mycena olivaceomarginata]